MKCKILLIWTFCALTVLLLVCGCHPSAPANTTASETTEEASPSDESITTMGAEPIITEPMTTEAVATEPVTTEPVTTEPVTTEPVTTEPVTTEPVTTEPVTTEPVTTEPVTTEPVTTEPVTTEPATTEPVTTEPETLPCAHKDTEWRIFTAPTCTEPGKELHVCTLCGLHLNERSVDAPGHAVVTDEAAEPTCTQVGKTAGSHCSVCGITITPTRPIPALGHIEVTDPAEEPTCTKNGRTEGSHCSACGEILKPFTVISFLEHTQVLIAATPPTCTKSGISEGIFCSTCGVILVECQIIPAMGHIEVPLYGYPPTDTTAGLTDGVICSVCNEILIRQDSIPPTGEATEDTSDPETESIPGSDTEAETRPTPEPETDAETETNSSQEPPYDPGSDADRWDGSIASGFAGGKGTESAPYRITTAAQLAFLAQQINSENVTTYTGKHFRLDANLDLDGREWTPIGYTDTAAFGGHFDGNGHTVSNFRITTQETAYLGLFGCVHGGTLQNLHVTSVTVNVHAPASVFASALVGYTDGNVRGCSAQGSVTVHTTEASALSFAGGLVGYQTGGEITNCSAQVHVSASAVGDAANAYAGGLAAYLAGIHVSNSYAHGNVYAEVSSVSSTAFAGGLVGEASKNALFSGYATGAVQARSRYEAYVGGLIGNHRSGQSIAGCWASGDVSALCENTDRCFVGGLAGRTKATITACYRYEGQSVTDQSADDPLTQTGESCSLDQLNSTLFYTDTLGWDVAVWNCSGLDFESSMYPVLQINVKN